jgi:hypothetical protein
MMCAPVNIDDVASRGAIVDKAQLATPGRGPIREDCARLGLKLRGLSYMAVASSERGCDSWN